MKKTWFEYFKEAMDGVGMPVPTSLFADATTALNTIKSIQSAIAVGGDVTIAELIGAGTLPEVLTVAGGVLASFYVGACIGAVISASAAVGWDCLSAMNDAGVDTSGIDVNTYAARGQAAGAADEAVA